MTRKRIPKQSTKGKKLKTVGSYKKGHIPWSMVVFSKKHYSRVCCPYCRKKFLIR